MREEFVGMVGTFIFSSVAFLLDAVHQKIIKIGFFSPSYQSIKRRLGGRAFFLDTLYINIINKQVFCRQ